MNFYLFHAIRVDKKFKLNQSLVVHFHGQDPPFLGVHFSFEFRAFSRNSKLEIRNSKSSKFPGLETRNSKFRAARPGIPKLRDRDSGLKSRNGQSRSRSRDPESRNSEFQSRPGSRIFLKNIIIIHILKKSEVPIFV